MATSRAQAHGGEAFTEASRSGKPAQAGTNRHRGHRERTMRGSPRATASARELRGTSEKEGGHGLRPCEDRRARVWLLARRTQLQKSSGDEWSRISSTHALQKERPRRVNRGLARSEGRRITPSASASSEGVVAGRALPGTGENRPKAQSGGRPSFSGGTIAKSGEVVAGPGL